MLGVSVAGICEASVGAGARVAGISVVVLGNRSSVISWPTEVPLPSET
jgi:hypothetical protein